MLVSDYMSTSPVTIREDANYRTAFEIMKEQDLHHIPVANIDNDVVGILSRRDLQLAASHYQEAPVEVSEVMHKRVIMIEPDASLATAAARMMENRIGSLPVSKNGRQAIGMITETDLLRALITLLEPA